MPLLEVRGLATAYGDSQVLFDLDLDVAAGEVVALLGRNGAGKTTTLASIMGLVEPRAGSIRFQGREMRDSEPHRMSRAGVGFVPENCRLFAGLTVAENLEAARQKARSGEDRWDLARVLELFPDAAGFLNRRAGLLSGGQQRMVAIARTLMGNPDLLLLDEPSEGLAPLVVNALLRQLKQLKRSGATVLISEQNLRFATELADRLYIIESGEVRYGGTPAELAAEPDVRQRYLMV
ncbi:MAG: ABC transporter ATP-binding protein [Alphaproteobacteria bacterium]|nr:ABC transporter ATP-binding protein [Alphaproteobacteria bacterium]